MQINGILPLKKQSLPSFSVVKDGKRQEGKISGFYPRLISRARLSRLPVFVFS
jgi:hypothetical protein